MIKSIAAIVIAASLTACISTPAPSNTSVAPSAGEGRVPPVPPVVEGIVKGAARPGYIPFSDYTTGDPVIATEAFVNGKLTGPAGGDLAGNYPNPTAKQVTGLNLYSDSVYVAAFRNSYNPQALRIYNSYTAPTAFDGAELAWDHDQFIVGTIQAGAGLYRDLAFRTSNLIRLTVTVAGQLNAPANYSPASPASLVTKANVDNAIAHISLPYDLIVPPSVGVGGPGQVLYKIVFTRTVTFPAGAGISRFGSATTPNADVSYLITKGISTIGKITFPSGTVSGQVGLDAATTYNPGDAMYILRQSSTDTTLSGVYGTLSGTVSN